MADAPRNSLIRKRQWNRSLRATGVNPHMSGSIPEASGNDPALAGIIPAVWGKDPRLCEIDPALTGTPPAVAGQDLHLAGIIPHLTGGAPAVCATQRPPSATIPDMAQSQPRAVRARVQSRQAGCAQARKWHLPIKPNPPMLACRLRRSRSERRPLGSRSGVHRAAGTKGPQARRGEPMRRRRVTDERKYAILRD
jgi:hypothetical protein